MHRGHLGGSVHYEPKQQPSTLYKTNMTQRDEVQKFEQGRIRFLQEERLHIQKKTFTKWMNSFLQKVRMEVEDLFTDLADGKKLLKLLEIISGEKLAKPNNGKMRVHRIENVNKSLAFLHTKVRLESIGAEDIVDGNPRLILGLIWTIILRFQIQEIEIDVDEENESSEKKSAKDALLLWAQRKTHGYANVNITDFTNSWRSGLGFNALIHAHRPDLFDYNNLVPNKHIDNLNHAFDVATNELGIPSLLDAEDVDNTRPDEKSIMTYVASYYHTFARMKNEAKSGRRIAKIINQMMDADKMKLLYDKLVTALLEWIRITITRLQDREFPNSLEGIQSLLLSFGHYRTQEKPPKYKERIEIEALYFQINTQLKELRQPAFVPVDGKLVQDIERAWDMLERAEHSREVALRSELMRQERLEQLNYKFERKSVLREGYLKEMIQVLSDPRYGSNLTQVDATVKKHEAISADILAREERFHDLSQMCEELVNENYRNSEKVKLRENEILEKWRELLKLLNRHKTNLGNMTTVVTLLREIDSTLSTINVLKVELGSIDTGVHLYAVEELLHKHALQELQVTSLGETERKLQRSGDQAAAHNPKEEQILRNKLADLATSYKELQKCSANRKALLEDARNFYQFLQDQEDEEGWLIEKQRICQADISAKDLRGVLSLQQKHKSLQDEIKSRKSKFDQLTNIGKQLIQEKHSGASEIQKRINNTKEEWEKLERLVKERTKQLQDAVAVYQFYADANEADSWLNDKTSILTSTDYGSDEPSAQALLQRHKDLQGELNAYKGDIQSLNSQAERLVADGISNLDLTSETEVTEPVEEWIQETRLVPVEVFEEEEVERIEHKPHTEERLLPQVRALYPFSGHGFNMSKGEVMFLLHQSNPDWWSVRRADGSDGFAPANYLVEIEPRIMHIQVRKPEKVKVKQKVKKTKMVHQKVPVKLMTQSTKKGKRSVDENDSIPKRQKKINDTYGELQKLAAHRHTLLEDAIRLFRFYRECDDFEKWIKDKEKFLLNDEEGGNVVQAKRKFEKFLTDLFASNKRIESLDNEVKELDAQNHSQIGKVRAHHKQVHSAWQRLNRLKSEKERSLEGASSVELFQRTCDEAKDWMLEKMMQLDIAEIGSDLKTVQALQRRHQNLERELAPVEEKVNRVQLLANSVKKAHPNERDNITKREDEIKELWQKVKGKAKERRNRLEDAVGHKIFDNSARALLGWIFNVKEQLNADTTARDVQTAQNLLKNHKDLQQDIKAQEDEFREVTNLGRQLLKSNPSLTDVAEKIERLDAEKAAILRGWNEKQKWLEQCLQLQMFNKEADNIDAATSSHQALLEFNDLGASLDEVEALLKQHRVFVGTLNASDERLGAFSNGADALIAAEHYDSQAINDKRNHVIQRRQAVKDLSHARTNALEASKNYQEFCAEVNDLRKWLAEKLKTASDESYRDLSNLERKHQKHEAFERELRANEGQLRTINKLGQALIAQDSYRKEDVAKTLHDLNDEWKHLVGISLDKGRRLREAVAQHDYNSALEDVHNKLDEIDGQLKNAHLGTDLRSCRDLLKRHELLESDLNLCGVRIDDLANQSEEMSQDGHFNSGALRDNAFNAQKRLKDLEKPVTLRKEALREALKFHMFAFVLDNELQWIKERLPLAASESLGQNLYDAQMFYKKHKKLETEIMGHQPVIDKVLAEGETLVDLNHPQKKKIQELCNTLIESWTDLNDKATKRTVKLELSLKAQQFFFDANEVESWLNEKSDILSNTDYGRDRDSSTKLLTKHKALELELDTYNSIIAEMGRSAQGLIMSGHPESKAIAERQATLEHLVRSLQRRAAARQHRLMESLFRHEYFLESGDLERWIMEKLQQATSEDYGLDYEHLIILQAKFDDFKHRVEAGSERFNQCEDLAQKLIVNESPYKSDIESKQSQLDEKWQKLREQIASRDKRLHAAGEIHRFHRDVADALSRIHEKNAALGTELGRDLNSALTLLRKQEAFENELVALEAQLQVLVDDGARLQISYPSNKTQIQQQQEVVVTAWHGLKERADLRRDQLQASVDLQKFLSQARDLTSWSSGIRLAMGTDVNVKDLASAQALKIEHESLKSEIEAREDTFQAVADMSTAMEQTGHYAFSEAVERCTALFQEREKLHTAWQLKKIHLDQLIDLLFFLRETKQIENICNTQEAALGNTDFGETVDEVDRQLKKHDAFEKLFNSQEERIDHLLKSADKLISQKHFESAQIATSVAEVQQKRLHLRHLCVQRRHQLENALLYAQFVRDVVDAQVWIAEKAKKLQSEIKTGEVSNLEEKMKELQKHQAFQAEIGANESRMTEIHEKGKILIAKRHKASSDIKQQLANLESAWKLLVHEVNLRGKGLEEAQDILEFNNQLDKLDAWIRDKEVMVQAGDTGRDFEHCQALQRKLDDVDSDMRVDDARIRNINFLADKLIHQGHSGVKPRRDGFMAKWQNLQGALSQYREKLAGALEVHLFNRDVDDTSERISEKAHAMDSEDVGKNLHLVEALQRKLEALEMEMTAVESKLNEHGRDAFELSDKYPHSAKHISSKLTAVQDEWNKLCLSKNKRRSNLERAYTKQKFLSDLKDLELWTDENIKSMEDTNKPKSISEAEALIELHNEKKAEIDGRQEVFEHLHNFGKSIKDEDSEIEEALERLQKLKKLLTSKWMKHKEDLTHEYQLQEFKEQGDQLESWLATKEAFLNNDDLGESTRAVETLMRKHQDFEKMLNQQMNRVTDLQEVAKIILSDTRYDNQEVKHRLQAILERQDRLLESSKIRKQKLTESQDLYEFRKNIYEVENWLTQKIQIAGDENYRDPSNLQSKIQKHSTFEAEILANQNRVQAVIVEGQGLITAKHFAAEEIQNRLEDLENDWKHLSELSQLKRERLNDAYQALLFDRSLDEFITWLDEVEGQLKSADYGRDLSSVNNLLKRHAVLENDIHQHSENCEIINETAEDFLRNKHFRGEELHENAQQAITRFHQLHGPSQAKRDLLEASSMLHQFTRDVEDELLWLAERELIAASTDLGNSLTAVQSLQKKHQVLETELLSREPVVTALVARGTHLSRPGHDSLAITEKANNLKNKLRHVRDLASLRKLRLQDALESQMFYTEAAEAEAWLNERMPTLASSDIGKDEDSAQMLLRKLEALKCEIESFQTTIDRLENLSKNISERQHFDSDNVLKKKEQIENKFKELQQLLQDRERSLSEALTYFSFVRECSEMQEWMNDQQAKAASEDYGTDVEHVELLIQAFDTFLASLNNSELRVQNCIDNGNKLIAAENKHKRKIEQKVTEVKDQWEDLIELAQARHEALAGAKQVHIFDRTADETIAWIIEKEANLVIDTYGQDLESIQALVRKHTGFETELVAVKEQVKAIEQEAHRLSELFPDAEEHIEVKREDTLNAWEELQTKAEHRRENLQQSEQLQTYFDQYQDLMAWINEMLAKVTAPDLPQDVSAAEVLIEHHKEHKVEIDARGDIIKDFYQTGHRLIQDQHFLSQEIQDRIDVLRHRMDHLNHIWHQRAIIYDHNLDVQLFKHEANLLENWMIVREGPLRESQYGDSILQVEELIRKHEDFDKTVEAQEEKFIALKRITLIEEAFARQLEEEAREKQLERQRQEQERLSQRKRMEVQRITEQRRLEEQKERLPSSVPEERMNGTSHVEDNNNAATPTSSLTKSNSVAHMFGDRIRKNSDGIVKRAESMKVSTITKPVKKTPSFTTRRRAGSFRNKAAISENELPPVEAQAFLERKQVLSAGGRRAQNRTWRNYYTVLCGQLLCFFKNKDDFVISKAIASPLGIYNAVCAIADDYYKRKFTFRLNSSDGAEFLFSCNSETEMLDWVHKISFRAKLPPSQQLINLEVHKDYHEMDVSSQSSRTSSPDISDTVVMRHDPQFQNGASQHQPPWRHTLTGHYGESSSNKSEWATPTRPSSTIQPNDHKKSSRIMDLFRKKRHSQI
ncbi:spectrin beta chain, non-erythrocytic 1 isoform X2 [Photinus pyralis]|uniref:spectrin beta chain, non-erythrocytic 1 isoform X2 n=1 Tax=Photinus pyralis TaxID=7054 RepID=UPI001266FDD4|nr:spectrin beta chain, non-erythrocytic 1 isoform X2 [Photinus pyralis]